MLQESQSHHQETPERFGRKEIQDGVALAGDMFVEEPWGQHLLAREEHLAVRYLGAQ